MNTNLEDVEITIVDRPKFYGVYQYSLSLAQEIINWNTYHEIKETLQEIINVDGFVSGSKHLLTYYLYFNDPSILNEIILFSKENNLNIHNIKQISKEFMGVNLKRKRYINRGKWYGVYSYRIRIKQAYFDFSDINDKLVGKILLSHNNPALFYMDNLNDVILFKLLYNEHILEMHDSETIRG